MKNAQFGIQLLKIEQRTLHINVPRSPIFMFSKFVLFFSFVSKPVFTSLVLKFDLETIYFSSVLLTLETRLKEFHNKILQLERTD